MGYKTIHDFRKGIDSGVGGGVKLSPPPVNFLWKASNPHPPKRKEETWNRIQVFDKENKSHGEQPAIEMITIG